MTQEKTPAIKAENLSYSYTNKEALKEVDFTIEKGEFVGIVGPNGSGKTTLIKLILNQLEPSQGQIQIFGTSSREYQDWSKIGYVPQKYEREQHFPATVKELLNLQKNHNSENGYTREKLIELLNLEEFLNEKFIELSGGQQQRVMVAISLIRNPEILILDEPSVGVDIKSENEFYQLLNKLNEQKDLTILLISHDVGMISENTDKVILVNQTICCEGKTSELPELMEMAYGEDYKVFEHMHGGHEH